MARACLYCSTTDSSSWHLVDKEYCCEDCTAYIQSTQLDAPGLEILLESFGNPVDLALLAPSLMIWYGSPLPGFYSSFHDPVEHSKKVCCNCQKTNSQSWYRSKQVPGGYNCMNCYKQSKKVTISRANPSLADRVCAVCQKTGVKVFCNWYQVWYKSITITGGFDCMNCYQKRRRKIPTPAKRKKPTDSAQAPQDLGLNSNPVSDVPLASQNDKKTPIFKIKFKQPMMTPKSMVSQ